MGKMGQPVQTVTALLNAERTLSMWEPSEEGRTPEQKPLGLDPADFRKSSTSETPCDTQHSSGKWFTGASIL